ncbi:MAG TPA: protease complex subunit PrcB family protein [Gemmatimonadaceae bacterium]|nr:protease complex subunit PrcB family protein [Gemmatimonadaceae bacterium]
MKAARLGVLLVMASACRTAQAAGRFATGRPPVPVMRFRSGETAFTTYSGLADSLRTVVRDSAAWAKVWQRVQQPFFPRPATPHVDFAREMVIVAALGQRPSAGYDVVIEGAERGGNGLTVDLRVTSPAPGCPVEAALTQPVDLGRVPITDGPVRFRERQVVVPCDTR